MNEPNLKTRHRDILGNDARAPKGDGLSLDKLKAYVQERVKIGDLITMPRDVYNVDHARVNDLADKEVIDFYTHYMLTVDDFGRHETYSWFNVYVALNGGMKPRPKPKPKKEGDKDEP